MNGNHFGRLIIFGLWGAILGGLSTVALSGGYSFWLDSEIPSQVCLAGLLPGGSLGALVGWAWVGLNDRPLYKKLLIISWIGLTAGLLFLYATTFVIYHATMSGDVGIVTVGVSVTLILTLYILAFAFIQQRARE